MEGTRVISPILVAKALVHKKPSTRSCRSLVLSLAPGGPRSIIHPAPSSPSRFISSSPTSTSSQLEIKSQSSRPLSLPIRSYITVAMATDLWYVVPNLHACQWQMQEQLHVKLRQTSTSSFALTYSISQSCLLGMSLLKQSLPMRTHHNPDSAI